MDKLYIEVFILKSNHEDIFTTVESFLALYVYTFANSAENIELSLIESEITIEESKKLLHFKLRALPKSTCVAFEKETAIKDLRLPVFAKGNDTFIAGLCAVCREIVGCNSKPEIIQLLGFKSSCLQSSSEASVWTRFCEVDIIQAIQNLSAARQHSKVISELPLELVRLEKHMNEPVRMHNIYKLAREQASNENSKKVIIECTTAKETLSIAHRYVEGISFTIADLILYPSVKLIWHHFSDLSKHLPLTHQWLQEVDISFPACAELLKNFKPSDETLAPINDYHIPEAPAISLYKSDPKRYKPRQRIFTTQNEVDAILQKLKALQLKFSSESAQTYEQPSINWSLIEPAHERTSALPSERLERKRQQLENLANAVTTLAKTDATIVDFCAGTGHLGILLALQLPQCTIILLENKSNSLLRAKKRVQELNLKNVRFYQCNIDYFTGNFDVGTSLHACGTATDIVLQKCLSAQAAFVCCPCCYGALQPMPHIAYPLSKLFNTVLQERDFLYLAHTADQAHALGTMNCREETSKQGQLCMDIVDTDRKTQAEERGYELILTRLKPENCTPKNRLLVGWLKNKEWMNK